MSSDITKEDLELKPHEKLQEAIEWFNDRIGMQPAGKIIIPRYTDQFDIVRHWDTIKKALETKE